MAAPRCARTCFWASRETMGGTIFENPNYMDRSCHMGGCQHYDPFLGTRNIRCRMIIIGIQKGAHNFDNHPHRPSLAFGLGRLSGFWHMCGSPSGAIAYVEDAQTFFKLRLRSVYNPYGFHVFSIIPI